MSYLDWPTIATSKAFRNAAPEKKEVIRSLWTTYVAPEIHGDAFEGGVMDPGFDAWMRRYELPPKTAIEENVLPQVTMISNFDYIEKNPAYRKSTYEVQQQLKHNWFTRAAVVDPELRSMTPEAQDQFYRKLMTRYPATSTGILVPDNPEAFQKAVETMGRAKVGAVQALNSFLQGVGDMGTWAITAPTRLLLGDENTLTQVMMDVEKNREWFRAIRDDTSSLLTQTVPGFIGGAAALVGPGLAEGIFSGIGKATGSKALRVAGKIAGFGEAPMVSIERALAGKAAQVFPSGVIGRTPGLIEAGAKALFPQAAKRIAPLAFDTAGGAVAGAIQGIGQAAAEGKAWHTYLPRDITIGVGLEFAGRYLGAISLIRKVAKSAGVPQEKMLALLTRPFKEGEEALFGPELTAIFKKNPSIAKLQNDVAGFGPTGMRIFDETNPESLNLYAQTLDMSWADNGSTIEIRDKTGKVIKNVTGGTPEIRRRETWNFFENSPEGVEATMRKGYGKALSEIVQTSDQSLRMYMGNQVPEAGRRFILDRMDEFGVKGYDYRMTNDPADVAMIDDIYWGFNSETSLTKLNKSLRAKGIDMAPGAANSKETLGVLADIRQKIKTLSHIAEPVVTVKGRTSALAPAGTEVSGSIFPDMPSAKFMTDFPISNPQTTGSIVIGDAGQLRKILDKERIAGISKLQQKSIQSGKLGIQIKQFPDNQIVQLEVPLMDNGGNRVDVTLHFGSIKQAQKWMSQGITNAGNVFNGNERLIYDYDGWLAKMRKEMPREKFQTEYQPFLMLKAQALQERYYLGYLKGRYFLQDSLEATAPKDIKWFDSLVKVGDYLRNYDSRPWMKDMTGSLPISGTVFDELYDAPPPDPMHQLVEEKIKRNKNFGIMMHLKSRFRPPQYVFDSMEKLKIAQDFEKAGMKISAYLETGRNVDRAVKGYITPREQMIDKLAKSVNKKQALFVRRLIESVEDQAEIDRLHPSLHTHNWEFRKDVLEEARKTFGQEGASKIEQATYQLSEYYRRMFAGSGLDWEMYIRRYNPHIVQELSRRNTGMTSRVDLGKITAIPSGDRPAFFEFLREADPSTFAMVDDPFTAAQVYTRLMGRKIFMRPAIKQMAQTLNGMVRQYKEGGEIPGSFLHVLAYIKDMLSSLQGISAPSDRQLENAAEETLQNIANLVNTKTGKPLVKYKGRIDIIGKAIGLGIGGQLAMRGYPIFKNLTQSLITGGSMIGFEWWMHGVDAISVPGAVQRLYGIAMSSPNELPIVGGANISLQGFSDKLVHIGMKGYSYVDVINRGIVYFGMEKRIQSALQGLQAGKFTKEQFIRKSGMKLFGKPAYNAASKMFNAGDYRGMTDYLARVATDKSQFLYESFESPVFARTAVGRLAAQYTSWPNNFSALLLDRINNTGFAPQSAAFIARLAAASGAIAAGAYAAGLNATEWAPWNNVVMSPGPYIKLVVNALDAARGNDLAARATIDSLVSMAPFIYAGSGAWQGLQAMGEGDWTEGVLHLLSAPIRKDVSAHNSIKPKALSDWLYAGYRKSKAALSGN